MLFLVCASCVFGTFLSLIYARTGSLDKVLALPSWPIGSNCETQIRFGAPSFVTLPSSLQLDLRWVPVDTAVWNMSICAPLCFTLYWFDEHFSSPFFYSNFSIPASWTAPSRNVSRNNFVVVPGNIDLNLTGTCRDPKSLLVALNFRNYPLQNTSNPYTYHSRLVHFRNSNANGTFLQGVTFRSSLGTSWFGSSLGESAHWYTAEWPLWENHRVPLIRPDMELTKAQLSQIRDDYDAVGWAICGAMGGCSVALALATMFCSSLWFERLTLAVTWITILLMNPLLLLAAGLICALPSKPDLFLCDASSGNTMIAVSVFFIILLVVFYCQR